MNSIVGYIVETFFDNRPQNIYELRRPDFQEDGFYRQATSFGAFFYSTRNPKANVTNVRQFTYHKSEADIFLRSMLPPISKTFNGIKEFFDYIGYDPKTRRYKSGERMKRWDSKKLQYK